MENKILRFIFATISAVFAYFVYIYFAKYLLDVENLASSVEIIEFTERNPDKNSEIKNKMLQDVTM